MPLLCVTSLDDPRLEPYRNLHQTNLTRGSSLFVVEGPLLVERLLASDYDVESVLVDERQADAIVSRVGSQVPVLTVPTGQVEKIIGYNFHRGVLACGRRRPAIAWPSVLTEKSGPATFVVAVEIHDPGNLGGVLRNCAAFGVDAVLLSPKCADPFSRRVMRVSMGASLRLSICESADMSADLALLKQHGVARVATVLDTTAQPLESTRRPDRLALLLGNEAHGLPLETVEQCDLRVTLPMLRDTDSLNVAVASGIFLYHLTRVAKPSRESAPISRTEG